MRIPALRYAFALSLLGFSIITAAGCGCGDDAYDPQEACDKVYPVVERRAAGCPNASAGSKFEVCGVVCSGASGNKCSLRPDVDACVAALDTLNCDGISARSFLTLSACVELFAIMSTSCDSGGGGDDDD
jgi:hypothetical protein